MRICVIRGKYSLGSARTLRPSFVAQRPAFWYFILVPRLLPLFHRPLINAMHQRLYLAVQQKEKPRDLVCNPIPQMNSPSVVGRVSIRLSCRPVLRSLLSSVGCAEGDGGGGSPGEGGCAPSLYLALRFSALNVCLCALLVLHSLGDGGCGLCVRKSVPSSHQRKSV